MSTANREPKTLVWLHGEVKTLPFSEEARIETGVLLGRLQNREIFGLPHSRPMPSIGPRCNELRVKDENQYWRIVYRIDIDAILIVEVFKKTTQKTPKAVIDRCKARLKRYSEESQQEGKPDGP